MALRKVDRDGVCREAVFVMCGVVASRSLIQEGDH
jgi:hypothetical protein